MNVFHLRRLAPVILVAGLIVPRSVLAQDSQPTYEMGDKVEVKDVFAGWKEGMVVGTTHFGRIKVRVEDPDIPLHLPKFARDQMMTRTYDLDEIRPISGGAAAATAAEPRTWTDRSGKFSVEARFGGMEGTQVILMRRSGKKVLVPLEKLSEEDKAYVHEQMNPPENPFRESDDQPPNTPDAPLKQADRSAARTVKPQKFTKWTFVPAGNSNLMPKTTAGRTVAIRLHELPDLGETWETVTGIFATDDGTRVAIGRQEGLMHDNRREFLEIIDVAAGKSQGLMPLPAATSLLDVDVDTDRVLYRSDRHGFGNQGVLTIARLAGGKLTPVVRWEPYGRGGDTPDSDIYKAWFMGPERVVTIDHWRGSIVVWDAASTKTLLQLPIGRARQVSIAPSPDRNLLAIAGDSGIFIIDAAAGRHVATIPIADHVFGNLAFRADNARLAGLSDLSIYVWDLASGEQIAKFNTPSIGTYEVPLQWAGDYLLAENCYLFDVDRRILLWQYQDSLITRENGALHRGQFYLVPESSRDSMLMTMPMPHAAAVELAKTLPSAEDLLIAKAGDPVSIEIEMDPSVALTPHVQKFLENSVGASGDDKPGGNKIVMLNPDDTTKELIRQALAAALERAGFEVVRRSNLVVKAVCKPQPQQMVRINIDGRFPPRPQDFVVRTITPHATYLAFMMNDEILWKRGFIAKPDMVLYLKKGETLDQALERVTQPNMMLFTHMEFGSHVARPGDATEEGAYGVSRFLNGQLVDGQSRPSGNVAFE